MAIMMADMDELLTTEEVARILRVTEDTARRLFNAGDIEAIRLRGQWRVKRDVLQRYLEAQTRQTPKRTTEDK